MPTAASAAEPTVASERLPLPWLVAAAFAAVGLPTLLAYNLSPSPTFLNQALSLAGWGAFLVAAGGALRWRQGPGPLLLALALLGAAVAVSWRVWGLPCTLALSALGLLGAAALLAMAGAATHDVGEAGDDGASNGTRLFFAFALALLLAGAANVAVALVQVFVPGATDGTLIATSGIAGRAVGNLRQPNHLSSVLTLAAVALVVVVELRGRLRPGAEVSRRAPWLAALAMALLVWGIVLTASRTGLVSVLLLAMWGLLDKRLARSTRGLLLAAPLLYGLAWGGMALWAAATEHTFGGAARLAETDITGSRLGIWLNTLELIRREPWLGVGFGQFNLAWSLTPFPGRPTAFFDHTHNLPLQLAVELGLPLALLLCALLGWMLMRAAARAWRRESPAAESARHRERGVCTSAAVMMVAMAGLHSLLEYPLWYAYFLLPTAWAWGWALGVPRSDDSAPEAPRNVSSNAALLAGAALVLVAALSTWDYLRVVRIFSAPPGSPPLAQRVAEGRQSWLFGHHADYAAVTSGLLWGPDAAPAFARATHYLLDTRLTTAWARWLEAQGRRDEARQLALRLREFRRPESNTLFEDCPQPRPAALADPPAGAYACEAPTRAVPWREFVGRTAAAASSR
jgi:O-antigen ligase